MARLDVADFKPNLKAGCLIKDGNRVYFESEEAPITRVLLPPLVEQMIPLMNGEVTCRELFSFLASRLENVSPSAVFLALERLAKANVLRNSSDWSLVFDVTPISTKHGLKNLVKPFFSFPILDRTRSGRRNLSLFITFATVTLLGSFCFLYVTEMHATDDQFFQYGGSYLKGLLFLYLCASALISVKHLVKTLLLFAISGQVFRASIQISIHSIAYVVDEELSVLGLKPIEFLIYSFASLASPFLLVSLESFMTNDVSRLQSLLTLAILISLIDWDPHSSTEVVQLFRKFSQRRSLTSKSIANTSWGSPRAHQSRWALLYWLLEFSYSFAWTACALKFLDTVIDEIAPNLLDALQSQSPLEKAAVGIVLLASALFASYVIYDVVRFTISGLTRSLNSQILQIKSRAQRRRVSDLTPTDFIPQLIATPQFAPMSQGELRTLLSQAKMVAYAKGAPIFLQGARARCLFIVVKGAVTLSRREKYEQRVFLATALAPLTLGDCGLTDHPYYETDLLAETDVELITLPLPQLEIAIPTAAEAWKRLILQAERVQRMKRNSVFESMPFELLSLVSRLGTFQLLPKSTIVVEEGDKCLSLNIMIEGSIEIWSKRQRKGVCSPGSCFGDISLGTAASKATYITAEQSLIFTLKTDVLWKFISDHIQTSSYLQAGQSALSAHRVHWPVAKAS